MTFYQPLPEKPEPPLLDDTQPRRPADWPPPTAPAEPPARASRLLIAAVALIALCLACSIVTLAGLAGYNDGVRYVERMAQVTRQADAQRQYALALTDVAGGNGELAALRLEHVVLTLGAPSGDAVLLLTQVRAATATPTPSPSPTVTETPAATPTPEAPAGSGGAVAPVGDPEQLFAQAQAAFVAFDYARTVELLDILRGVDDQYRAAEVREMLRDALAQLALTYLREPSGDRLAEGILLAERARALGSIGDLDYEAYIAGRYLEARNMEGVECALASNTWQSLYDEVPQYRDVAQRLFNAYVDCGDRWAFQNEYCPAAQYYSWALSVLSDSDVASRRNNARDICAVATPTPTPTLPPEVLTLTPPAPPQ